MALFLSRDYEIFDNHGRASGRDSELASECSREDESAEQFSSGVDIFRWMGTLVLDGSFCGNDVMGMLSTARQIFRPSSAHAKSLQEGWLHLKKGYRHLRNVQA
jgi:hypothetical protein